MQNMNIITTILFSLHGWMDLLVDRSTRYLLQKILQAVSFLIGFDIQNMFKLVYLEIKLKYIHIKLIRKFTKNKGLLRSFKHYLGFRNEL